VPLEHFKKVTSAVLGRHRLRLRYYARSSDRETERDVSPQRLVHYRDNWYLDAWCHLRDDLRSFSVDGIRDAEVLPEKAISVQARELDVVLGEAYGIFSGRAKAWATLRFTPERARWVASESWHPRQKSKFEEDGSYVLEIPYSDDRELLGDILRHGPEVEVLAPKELRERCHALLVAACGKYAIGNGSPPNSARSSAHGCGHGRSQ
jgi:predicted DNA-binding transcriptional regulator YafY